MKYLGIFFTEKERETELIASERCKIEENIERLSSDIQKEENEREKKRQVFVEDLDKQVEEKKTNQSYQERKEQMFRDTNALADKLSKFKIDEPVIAVSENLLLENHSVSIMPSIFFQDFRRRRAKWT